MKYFIRIVSVIGLLFISQIAYAGSINDTYTTGDTLTATKMDNIKSAVNGNATDITTNASGITTNATDITTNASGITTNASGITTNATNLTTLVSQISAVDSLIDTSFSGDGSAGELNITGVVNWVTNPPANPFFTNVILFPGSTLVVPAGTTIYCSGTFLNSGTLIVEPGASIGGIGIITSDSASNGLQAYAHPGDTPAPASMGETNNITIQPAAPIELFEGRGGLPIPRTVATTSFGGFKIGGGSGGGYGAYGGQGGGLLKIYANINILNSGTIDARGEDGSTDGIGGGGGGIVILAARNGQVQNQDGIIDVSGGNGVGNSARTGNGGGGGGGIVVMASSPIAPLSGTEIVSGGLGATGNTTLTENTQTAGGGGGGSGGQGGNGGRIQNGTPTPGLNGSPGYVLSLTIDPIAIAR